MCVHVAGAVRQPGVYVLPVGTRIGMAIDVAGGVSAHGATDAINLAAKLEEMKEMRPIDGKAAAYVCENFTCKAPVTLTEELRKLLTR
jgi:competence protein ComEA